MKDLKEELIFWTHYLAKKGLISGSEGNLSIKIGSGFFITPSGKIKEIIQKRDLSYISFSKDTIIGNPSSEWGLHLEIYLKCKRAKAVVHCHPPFVLTLERLGFSFREFNHPEAQLLKNLSILPYFPPGSYRLWEFASNLCRNNQIVILSKHGVITWGEQLEEAINLALLLEKLSYLEYLAKFGGKV
ncbi:MAG: class II aldolase/adducin family protein [Thermodesulfobacteriaceae bacterium]|nr:class II aldolase/adducin family protein [Thermodesulfobacteriaceae bacterium]